MGKRFKSKLEQLDRLKEILLAHPDGLRKAELARRLGVHRSTVADYLDDLSFQVPVYEPMPDYFAIDREMYRVQVLLTLDEAVALHLASRLLATRTDKHYAHGAKALRALGSALEQIAPLVSEHLRRSANVLDGPDRRQDPIFMQALEQLTRGWAEGRKVRLTHEMEDGRVFEYRFAPYFIEPYAVGRTMHVIGWREPPGALRTFKIERIRTIELLDEPYALPETFDPAEQLKDAWGIWSSEEAPEQVVLRFSRNVAHRVRETRWHHAEEVRELPDGGLEWRAPVAAWREMVPWIRGWGADVEVVGPVGLRHLVEEHVLRMASMYGLRGGSNALAIAHSRNHDGKRHLLVTHLKAVAALAAEFAESLHASSLARYLGLWHDLGKFHPAFQQYLQDVERPDNERRRGPDHKAAGVRKAFEVGLEPLALLLQGHHGGLKNRGDLRQWYERCKDDAGQALTLASDVLDVTPTEQPFIPDFVESNPNSAEFFLRMLFSALVDADFLDTEAHFAPGQTAGRGSELDVTELWQRFDRDQQRLLQNVINSPVNRSRLDIYDACILTAKQPTGLFRLSVPTGGGKTRSGMAFALRHALEHGQQRVIVAVPYITITQQTAEEYRRIFSEDDEHPVVLEHHSGPRKGEEEADKFDPDAVWQRLSAENWDAPIIVTTTVQLFESLFANSTSRCRKLHRLANSVIILDEAQSMPANLLDPMLDVLRELCLHYGSTVVLSTATQPAFEALAPIRDLNAREIVPNPEKHFEALKRVEYDWRQRSPMSWDQVAELMENETQALAICNTKQDALDLMDALDDPQALHLSTLLCGKHRMAVIKTVKERLEAGEPCRLIATQVVEAGVDIDFPLVLRALGPLDSIVQAAGRANREGMLDSGRVIIFEPAEGGLPPGAYERATNTTRTMLNTTGPIDMHNPATLEQYYQKWYPLEDTDSEDVQKWRARLDYPEVARRFRMIKDDSVSVVITSYGAKEERRRLRNILEQLRKGAPPTRRLLRQLRPYTVSLWKHKADVYLNEGFLSPKNSEGIAPDMWEWTGSYDVVRGLSTEMNADALVF